MKIKGFNLNPRKVNRIKKRLRNLPKGSNLYKYVRNKSAFLYLSAIKSTRVVYPSSVVLEVTNHCNLKCITCPLQYDSGQAMDKGLINVDSMLKIVDEVAPYVDNIGLTGMGETLINKNLEKVLKYIKAKKMGIQTSISTNAHLPTTYDYLKRILPYLDQLQVSIDGIGAVYNEVRVEGNFDFFVENVRKIKPICDEFDVPILFNFTIVKENFHQMPEILKLAEDLGVQYVNMNPINITAVSRYDISYYDFFTSDEYVAVLNKTIEVSKKIDNVTLSLYDYKSENGFKKCIYPWMHNYVTWDGYLIPCCARPFPKELNYGNVFKDGLLNCLNNEQFREVRRMWYNNETPKFCEDCIVCVLKPITTELDVAVA
ncbi:radical SAM protein [Flavobacterium supellecticarium]|uniref:Radical SAM protein n=1 Tax=Flavobacterium supellecticarium TaxID=2565924 RepID=A0A4S4A4E7_9FLAO|nr:radical SAM protein [Flavobacterium supellecticarium]THF53327.1 radical SAM protein [Flavobacterium supellecticarium]